MGVPTNIREKDELLYSEVAKMMQGDFSGYEQLYALSYKYFYKIIWDIVQNYHTTEDLLQETYLQIYDKIHTLKEPRAFYVWGGRIATNLTLRHIQKYRKELLTTASGDDEDGADIFDRAINDHEEFIPETVFHNAEQQRIIADILDGLSVEQKLCVQYYYYEEMSVGEIASMMECSEGTIKSRLNYARKSIKEAVGQFERKNNVKLYSLGAFPVFFMLFRTQAEACTITEAGLIMGGMAEMSAQQAVVNASNSAMYQAQQAAANASNQAMYQAQQAAANASNQAMYQAQMAATVTPGTTATTSAVVTTGTVQTTGAAVTASTVAATATGTGAAIAAKIAIVVVTLGLTVGGTKVVTDVAQERYHETSEIQTREEILEESEEQNNIKPQEEKVLSESSDIEQGAEIQEFLGVSEADLEGLNADYLAAINALAEQMLRYQEALEYSLTDEQFAYVDQLMAAYFTEMENYLLQGEAYAEMEAVDASGTFIDVYMPELVSLIEWETRIISDMADVYASAEVKQALTQYTAQDIENVLNSGGGIGNLVAEHISPELQKKLYNASTDLMNYLDAMVDWATRLSNDENLQQYFQ
ncbi:MAG: RNA polymerase sigma factor [Lachnospiraceae bacterium]|nr:RNA polymerase sigma factor [Lachnospiraceae bacterium]